MTDNTYECESCRGTFLKGWSDEEARQEHIDRFGCEPDIDNIALICEQCNDRIESVVGMTRQ